jgi:hypothetical protein
MLGVRKGSMTQSVGEGGVSVMTSEGFSLVLISEGEGRALISEGEGVARDRVERTTLERVMKMVRGGLVTVMVLAGVGEMRMREGGMVLVLVLVVWESVECPELQEVVWFP